VTLGLLEPVAVTVIAVAGGTAATYLDRDRCSLPARVAIGVSLAFALLGVVALPIDALFGITRVTTAVATVVVGLPVAMLFREPARRRVVKDMRAAGQSIRLVVTERDRHTVLAVALLVAFASVLLVVAQRTMFITAAGIQTGSKANELDLALHLGIINNFVDGGTLPPQHPEFAGVPLTYPFLIDFTAALLVSAGASLPAALLLQNALLLLALVALLSFWTWEFTGDRAAAVLAPPLVLLGGGLGWLLMLRDLLHSGETPVRFLMNLPTGYTILRSSGLEWGNILVMMLMTQRSILLGMPLALAVLLLWWRTFSRGESEPTAVSRMTLAGLITGLLPLAHTHSFAVILTAGAALALLFRRWRCWIVFFAVALVLSVPQLWWIGRGSPVQATSFFAWEPGWTKESTPLIWFWFKNTGVFIPLLIIALAAPARVVPSRLRRFYIPFLAFLILPNLFRMAPRMWDNNKVLVYWYIASVPFVAILLSRFFRSHGIGRVLAVGLTLSLVAAGALDVVRILSGSVTRTVFDRNAIEFARLLAAETPPEAVIVRAPTSDHPALLAGRPSLLGYESRVRSHGLKSDERAAQLGCIYTGCPDAVRLLRRYSVQYVVVGPAERENFAINEHFLQRLVFIGGAADYALYQVPTPALLADSKRTGTER
jgi:hypothetical protein